ncbi:HD domain-containing protein [Candidatus Leptofilum sp.]|uniref:HD domain-containing protein n=1 Tax=Candidatus Leptofilum sp. TaxID=3241576 RepID=UPI003B58BAE5
MFQKLEFQCKAYLKQQMATDAAHDMQHVERVVLLSRRLAAAEGANLAVVLPAAWLHDCVTLPKNAPNRQKASQLAAAAAVRFLRSINYPEEHLEAVAHAIAAHSFSAGIAPTTLEAKVVQDADRLDAIGAIGVARCLLVGGALERPLYNPADPFCESREPDDLAYTIDHFYRKLFKIGQTLHTQAAREEATRRNAFMRAFLDQLRLEI